MSPTLEQAVRDRRVIVCVGSGGVGKTTVAAALALKAATLGRRVVVCTIDPAKRLANALGLAELGNVEAQVDAARLRRAGLDAPGELWAMMLDLKRSWDDFIRRHLPEEKHEAVLSNRFYQTLSSALAGSQEYIALEKLYDLYSKDAYDLVVLDTPPTAQALDFLEAPNRVLDFLDNEAIRTLLGPALSAGKMGFSLFRVGSGYVARTISKLIGMETLQELADFLLAMQGTLAVSKDRAAKVKGLLGSPEAAFVLVTSPNALTVDEAIFFHDRLIAEGMPVASVVANRVHPDFFPQGDAPDADDLRERLTRAGMTDDDAPPFSQRLAQAAAEAHALSWWDERELDRLRVAVDPTTVQRIHRFERDVFDLPDLWQIDRVLFGSPPVVATDPADGFPEHRPRRASARLRALRARRADADPAVPPGDLPPTSS